MEENVDLKKDTNEAKGFFSSFFKNPLGKIKEVTFSVDSKFVKIAMIILIVWLAILLVSNVLNIATTYLFGSFGSFSYFFQNLFRNIFNLIKTLITPLISILVLSGLVYGFKKVKNKSFLAIASSIVITKIPVVIASAVNLLVIVNSQFIKISSNFAEFCNILSIVLLFFTMKDLLEDDNNDSYFWKFALIMGIYYIVKFIFSFLGIFL